VGERKEQGMGWLMGWLQGASWLVIRRKRSPRGFERSGLIVSGRRINQCSR